MVKISIKDGKYVVDATIHTEVSTPVISKVQESFAVDCAAEFEDAIRTMVINNQVISDAMEKAGKEHV